MGGAMHRSFAGITAAAHRMRGALKGAVIGAGAATGAAALGAVTAAAYGLVKGFKTSIDAALAVEATHEKLGLTLERTAKRWGLSLKQIELQKQGMIAMGDTMAELGIDGETVVTMLGEVTSAVDPRSLHQYKKGLTDLLVTNKGFAASEEEAAELGRNVAQMIEFKMPKALKKFKGVTAAQIAEYSKLETREQRQIWFFKNIAKETGATEAAAKTASGRVTTFWNKLEDMGEKIGKPFVELRGQLAETGIAILEKLQPTIEKFAAGLQERLAQANKWWSEHQEQVVEALGKVGDAILWVVDHWKELSIAIASVAAFATLTAAVWLCVAAFTALAALFSPVGLIIVGLVAVGVAVAAAIIYWDDLKAAAVGAWEAINKASQTAVPPTSSGTGVPFERQPGDYVPEWQQQPGGPSRTPGYGLPEPAAAPSAQLLDAENRRVAAAIRNRNPGAMYPGAAAQKFGTIGTQSLLGGKHKIAQFPTAVHGAAANFENLATAGYVGKTIRSAMTRWSGGYRSMPGPAGQYDPNTVITREMVNDPNFAIPFMQAIASGEAPGGHKVLSQGQWRQAYDWYKAGGPQTAGPKTGGLGATTGSLNKRGGARDNFAPISLTMNSPTTINGASAGQEQALLRQHERILQDTNRAFLSKLREVQNDERAKNLRLNQRKNMIQTLIVLLVMALVLYLIWFVAGKFIQGTPLQIIGIILGLVWLLYALSALGLVPAFR